MAKKPVRPTARPLFAQIQEIIVERLVAGEWRPGEPLPSENEFAEFYNVSQGTVRKAIAQMAATHHLPFAPHDCTGPVTYTASTHMSVSEPNALIQESVRAFYNGGWYNEVSTALPIMENGYVRPPEGPGLGMELLPEVRKRKDAVVQRTTAKDL